MTRSAKSAAALVAFQLLSAAAQPLVPCRWSPPEYPSLSYDLSGLYSSTLDYNWRDPFDAETTQSNYTFNVCTNVNSPPVGCLGNSPAFQVTGNGGGAACYPLGVDLKTPGVPNLMTWALIDPLDPSAGVSISYRGAALSPGCPTGVLRTFTLEMGCSAGPVPQPGPTPRLEGMDETDICNYRAHAWSLAGCPQQCPVVGGQLCGGNGVCRMDYGINSSRCFCYDNWTEKDCQSPSTPFPSGAIAGAVIGGMLVGALATLGAVWGWGLHRQRSAAAAPPDVDGFYAPVKV